MSIICLFGPDGSGKTTLARELAKKLSARGFDVKVRWMRGSHTFISLLSLLLSRCSVFTGGLNPYYGFRVPRGLIRIWWFLEWVSAIPVILRYVLPNALGYVIVADRFVLDFVVWIALTTDDVSFFKSFFSHHLVSLALRSGPQFFLTASLGELVKRSGSDAEFLRKQLILYGTLIKAYCIKAYIIDTTYKTQEESLKEILSTLEKSELR